MVTNRIIVFCKKFIRNWIAIYPRDIKVNMGITYSECRLVHHQNHSKYVERLVGLAGYMNYFGRKVSRLGQL